MAPNVLHSLLLTCRCFMLTGLSPESRGGGLSGKKVFCLQQERAPPRLADTLRGPGLVHGGNDYRGL